MIRIAECAYNRHIACIHLRFIGPPLRDKVLQTLSIHHLQHEEHVSSQTDSQLDEATICSIHASW